MSLAKSATLNYLNVFYSFFINNDSICHDKVINHYLVYVYSGEMILKEDNKEIIVSGGECIFIRRNHRVKFTKRSFNNEPFKSVSLVFERSFLRQYFHKLNSEIIPYDTNFENKSVFKFSRTPQLESLFSSLIPYFETQQTPDKNIIELRMQEGLYCLLKINKNFFPILFDFNEPWKIDILDFLNENYMYNLELNEIAHYTGRSLSTFKRDFKKISKLSPQKWLINKRLEIAHDLICNRNYKVNETCYEVGFKSPSHFATAFKKQYGYSPSYLLYKKNNY